MTCPHLSQEYFFDPEVLTEGEVAPNDRCCRICGKIGHFMKDCPLRKRWVQCIQRVDKCLSHNVSSFLIYLYCGSFLPRSKHRWDSDKRQEHQRDRMDSADDARDQVRHKNENWRKRDALEIRCCYLCGSSTHIKKDCQLYRNPAGSRFFSSYYLISLFCHLYCRILPQDQILHSIVSCLIFLFDLSFVR